MGSLLYRTVLVTSLLLLTVNNSVALVLLLYGTTFGRYLRLLQKSTNIPPLLQEYNFFPAEFFSQNSRKIFKIVDNTGASCRVLPRSKFLYFFYLEIIHVFVALYSLLLISK
jgi:hypothetical protein